MRKIADKNNLCFSMLFMGLLMFFSTSCENDPEMYQPESQNEAETLKAGKTVELIIQNNNKVAFSGKIFGVNNDWRVVSNARFTGFSKALTGIKYTNLRFPGGWESEYYDWSTNSTPEWNNAPKEKGASISTVLSKNPPSLSIVVPTVFAMNQKIGTKKWKNGIEKCKLEAEDAIRLTGVKNITTVEIGNEWWLQYAMGDSRSNKCEKYGQIAKQVAKHIHEKYPKAKFKVLVNGDYTKPDEFSKINKTFGKDLKYIDGCALHTYAGYNSTTHDILKVGDLISSCRSKLGKDYVHLSEWAPSKAYNKDKIYAQAANVLVELVHEMARAGADAAAYWPPHNSSIPGLGLFDYNHTTTYPTGQLLKDMSENYKGEALLVTSNGKIRGVAAKNGKRITVYVAGFDNPATTVKLRLKSGTPKSKAKSSKVFVPGSTKTSDAKSMELKNNTYDYKSAYKGFEFKINSKRKYEIAKFIFELK